MQNYFALFGLHPSFMLDEAALDRAYIALQQQVHPDRMIGKSDTERAIAIQLCLDANDAMEALKNPLSRAQHLLALHGVVVNQDEGNTMNPPQSLPMEMLELREMLREAQEEIEVARQVKEAQEAMEATCEAIEEAFEAEDYPYAAEQTIRLRYLEKFLEEGFVRQHQVQAEQ